MKFVTIISEEYWNIWLINFVHWERKNRLWGFASDTYYIVGWLLFEMHSAFVKFFFAPYIYFCNHLFVYLFFVWLDEYFLIIPNCNDFFMYGPDHVQVNWSWKWIVNWEWIVGKELGWSANCWPNQPKFYPTIHFRSTIHFQLVHDLGLLVYFSNLKWIC